MLKKLMKYEFKGLFRLFLPIFIIICVWTPLIIWRLNALVMEGNRQDGVFSAMANTFDGMIIGGGIMAFIAISIAAVVLIYYRYYKTLTSADAYLYNIIPVTAGQHLIAKSVAGFVYLLITYVLLFISGTLIFTLSFPLADAELGWSDFWAVYGDKMGFISGKMGLSIFLIILFTIVSVFFSLHLFYLSANLGMQSIKHRGLITVLIFIGFNFAVQFISSVTIGVSSLASIPFLNTVDGSVNFNQGVVMFFNYINSILLISTLVTAGITVAFYFINRMLLSKKLNIA